MYKALPALILLIVILIIPLSFLIAALYEEYKYNKAKKQQHLMFCQLKPGNIIWLLSDAKLYPHKVKDVDYIFSHNNNSVKEITIRIDDWYDTLHLTPEQAKSFRYQDYYTIYVEAEAKSSLEEMKRNKAIGDLTVDNEEIMAALKRETDALEKLKDEVIEQINAK